VLLAISGGDIAKRGLVDGRAEIGERDFALRVVNTSGTIEAGFVTQEIFRGLARMLDQLQGLNDIAQNRSILTEGCARDQENK